MSKEEAMASVDHPNPYHVGIVMFVFIFFLPYLIEIQYTDFVVVSIIAQAWTWKIPILGYAYGETLPVIISKSMMYTGLQILFLFVLVFHYKHWISRRKARYMGYISAFPGLLIFIVNMLFVLVPGQSSLNVWSVVPLMIPTFFGLFLLWRVPYLPIEDEWLTQDE